MSHQNTNLTLKNDFNRGYSQRDINDALLVCLHFWSIVLQSLQSTDFAKKLMYLNSF